MTDRSPDELLASAKRRLQVADHFLTQTYPQLGDPKLLVNILDGVLKACEELIDAALITEHTAGRLGAYHETNTAAKIMLFTGDIGRRFGLSTVDLHMISEMQEILHEHREAAMEFQRNGKLVMANDEFNLITLSPEKIKTYLSRTKTLFTKVHDRISTP